AIFKAIRYDDAAILVQRSNYAALASSITGTNGGMQVTESTVNGQSFTARHSSTSQERFQVLSILMTMIDTDSAGTKTVRGRFR
ncbi:hypothetical protein OE165_27560, partial [Escherichia coli]|uniref:hypothetical protein n=1 Tax=Escherichia coli TaxID=562 RepID=UPI0021F31D33